MIDEDLNSDLEGDESLETVRFFLDSKGCPQGGSDFLYGLKRTPLARIVEAYERLVRWWNKEV